MRSVTKVVHDRGLLPRTLEVLQHFGREGCEGFALWVGEIAGAEAKVVDVLVPKQRSIKGEDGVGYFLETDTLAAVGNYLSKNHLRLIAQVHSHPTEAYHSTTDDRYAIATAEGSFSLVVPDFGFCLPKVAAWAVYRLTPTGWKRQTDSAVAKTFLLRGSNAH